MEQIKTHPFVKKLMQLLMIIMLSMLAVTSVSITAHADAYDFDEGDPSAKSIVDSQGHSSVGNQTVPTLLQTAGNMERKRSDERS